MHECRNEKKLKAEAKAKMNFMNELEEKYDSKL